MNTFKFVPEGWNNEITKLNQTDIDKYMKNKAYIFTIHYRRCYYNSCLHAIRIINVKSNI